MLASTNITEEGRKKFDTVLLKLDELFEVRRHAIFERVRFNQCNKIPGESVEKFISELYLLAENCKYRAMNDELIRDRLAQEVTDAINTAIIAHNVIPNHLHSPWILTIPCLMQWSARRTERIN